MEQIVYPAFDATETIDLETLGLDHLSQTGSFVVSGLEESSFGKLIHGLPMPVLLLGMPEPYIHLMNGPGAKFVGQMPELGTLSLFSLFSGEDVSNVQRSIGKLYSTRKHQTTDTWTRVGNKRKWARMHFQSLRLSGKRYALLVIEDLTHEKEALREKAIRLQEQNDLLRHEVSKRVHAESELKKKKQSLEKTLWNTIGALSSIAELRDPYTAGHQKRVTQLARAIAQKIGLDERRKTVVAIAASVHDIGKVRVPNELLSKPIDLDDLEYAILKRHPEDGYNIMRELQLPVGVAEAVFQHHERVNGGGYPRGLKGEGISLEARIIGVADVAEAMSSPRPYRPALGQKMALDEIAKNSGTLYDPTVVDACHKILTNGFKFS
jgi:putative nucleotidyltransferase with HDIG domain